MPELIISDTSVLIILSKIGYLDILQKLYSKIIITKEIAFEYKNQLPDWIEVKNINNPILFQSLKAQIDPGEASAICLALEIGNCFLLLDDLKGRKLAQKMNLKFTGTLGILNKAKQLGIIKEIKPIIELLLELDFRISQEIINEILRLNNE